MISINSSLIHSKIAGLGKELKSGDFVFLKVLSGFGKEYQVSIRGVVIPVKSDLKLPVGTMLKARLFIEGDKYTFKLENEGGLPKKSGVVSSGISAQSGSGPDRLIRAFIRTGLALSPELLGSINSAARIKTESDDFIARLASLMLKKGLVPNAEGLENLVSAVQGYGSSGGKSGQGGLQDESKGKPGNGMENDEKSEDRITPADLKAVWQGKEESNPLQLFNHISSGDEHWFILPFSFGNDDTHLEGFTAVKVRSGKKVPDSLFVRCYGKSENHDFFINWNREENSRLMKYSTPLASDSTEETGNWKIFLEKLQNLGVKSDDNINRGIVFDGFSAEREHDFNTGFERFG